MSLMLKTASILLALQTALMMVVCESMKAIFGMSSGVAFLAVTAVPLLLVSLTTEIMTVVRLSMIMTWSMHLKAKFPVPKWRSRRAIEMMRREIESWLTWILLACPSSKGLMLVLKRASLIPLHQRLMLRDWSMTAFSPLAC